jgi:thioredoxin 1
MIELTQENFEDQVLRADLPVMVEFGAVWCVPCKRLEPELHKLAAELEGKMILGHINVDENPELAMNYTVMSVPTVMLFKNGEVQDRMTGFKPLQKIKEIFGGYIG